MNLTIVRSKWLIGNRELDTMLLHPVVGKMCCLGFYCRALGLDEHTIVEKEAPSSVATEIPQAGSWLLIENDIKRITDSDDCRDLMTVNDALVGSEVKLISRQRVIEDFTPELRERLITEIFAKHDVAVSFVD